MLTGEISLFALYDTGVSSACERVLETLDSLHNATRTKQYLGESGINGVNSRDSSESIQQELYTVSKSATYGAADNDFECALV